MVEDAQRGEQFAAEEAGAAAFPGERRQRLDDVEVAHPGTEAGFQAPDAGDHAGIDAEPVLHAAEQRTVLLIGGAAVGDALVGDQQGAVLRPGHGELGLVAVAFQHLLVGLHAGERALQCRRGDAGAPRLGAHAGEEALEAVRRGAGRHGEHGGKRGSQ